MLFSDNYDEVSMWVTELIKERMENYYILLDIL